MSFRTPLKEMLFVVNEVASLDAISALPGFEDANRDAAASVIAECGRFVESVLVPLNRAGDLHPATWNKGEVKTSPGYKEAFDTYAAAGWQGTEHDTTYGGMGLPKLISAACHELLHSGSVSFSVCGLLTDGAIEALLTAGSDALKTKYLANFMTGKWTGTMNLTEPQAGSDLSLVRSQAVKQPDGTYRITGEKIYITYGEHDLTENIVHLVLARTPNAPEGVKGISLFVVPKFMVKDDGTLGARNDVYCSSIEHKLGIKASPTAVLLFGDGKFEVDGKAGAIGEIVGEENRGLEYMFIMMNAARFGVGMQGIGLAERAYQQAVTYARDRIQSRDLAGSPGPVAIIRHPDVRRMLMMCRSQIEAARALAYVAAAAYDVAHKCTDPAQREERKAFYELLVPLVKGYGTELSVEVASFGVQVHGGMGFIEESGAPQHYRDARILPIYEGTTAIQANDLVGRKTLRDAGRTMRAALASIRTTAGSCVEAGGDQLPSIGKSLAAATTALDDVVTFILKSPKTDVKNVFAGSVPYLRLAAIVFGGWQMARAAEIATKKLGADAGDDAEFYRAKIVTARFFADHVLSQASGLRAAIVDGSQSVLALDDAQF